MPAEGDIVCLHVGPTRSTKDFRSIFRLTTARVDAALDCSEKEVHLIYQDESVRGRKQVQRGASYSIRSSLLMMTNGPMIPQMVPEKKYRTYPAFNSADCVGFITALQPSGHWALPRMRR